MKIKQNLSLLLLLFSNLYFAQTNSIFENKENDIKAKINLNVSDLTNGNSKTLIFGAIFSHSISNFETYDQNWLLPFFKNKIDAKFYVYPNIDNTGVKFNFEKTDSIEGFQSSQSMLVLIVSDTSVINFLNKNKIDLSIVEHCSKNFFTIYKLNNVSGYNEFKSKTNNLIHYLDQFEKRKNIIIQNKSTENSKLFNLQFSYKNSILNNSNEIELYITKESKSESKINFDFGLGLSKNNSVYQTNFNSFSRQASIYNSALDSVYCKLNNVEEEIIFNSILIKGFFGINYSFKKKNFITLEISPFFSVLSISNSKVNSGSVSTYGYYHEINEYLTNIPELNLKNNSNEIIGTTYNYNTKQIGLDFNLCYKIKLNNFSFKPFINYRLIQVINKKTENDFYSFNDFKYKGGLSNKNELNILYPTIGISFIF